MVVLNRIRETLIEAGIDCDPVIDLHTGDYRWTVNAHPPGREPVGIDLEINKSAAFGDERLDDQAGVNFSLRIVAWGGQILGGLAPFNHTPDFWVDATDDQAVNERFQLLEQADADPGELVNTVLGSPRSSETSDDR